jgi:hypothetical protein
MPSSSKESLMKQKFAIIRDEDQNRVTIREYAELDKEMMSLLCEESYSQETISAAVQAGHQAVIDALRTNNMYPPTVFADPIAKAIEGLFTQEGKMSAELFFDDKELFIKEVEEVAEEPEENVKEDVDVDELLDDNIEEDFGDDEGINKLKTSLKVSENDDSEVEDIG